MQSLIVFGKIMVMANSLTYIYSIAASLVVSALFSSLFLLTALNASFAQQPSQEAAAKVEKSMQDLEDYGRLEEKINSQEKTYIKEISVRGVMLLGSGEVKAVIEPYLRHWLTQKDIQQIIDSLKELYQRKSKQLPEISYRIEGYKLIIEAKE